MTRVRDAIAHGRVPCSQPVAGVTVRAGDGRRRAVDTCTVKCAVSGGTATGAPAGTTTRTVTVAGESRTYRIEVPAGYTQSRAVPLLFDFHGLGSNKEQQELYSRLELKGGKAGYVVVTPDGSGTLAKRWVPPPLPGTDLDFVRVVLHSTEQELCIDARRVFAAGMSSGAVFSTALACALPGTFAAIAPVAGVNAHAVCDPGTPPVSVLAFHGTADGVVPYQGGAFFSGVDAARLPAAIRDRVADLAGLQAAARARGGRAVGGVRRLLGHAAHDGRGRGRHPHRVPGSSGRYGSGAGHGGAGWSHLAGGSRRGPDSGPRLIRSTRRI